jgi:acyl-coenzyme A synthetase/AMP-(fatty) acid ligase/3-hydroxymyristoyl/3-hydroxydecanoyl-(acyl carrier protein) dehydratase
VAWRREGEAGVGTVVRWEELRQDVARLCERLSDEPKGGWLLLTEDAYAFAVGLLGLWHSGRHAILPPNRQQGTLSVLQTRASGVISDRAEWIENGSPLDPLLGSGRCDFEMLDPLSPDALALELYTSGTSGDEKSVTKRIRHLDDEIVELSESWNSLVGSSTVFSTASHQHIYGLLFGVLWPLCAGRIFHAHHFLHFGEMLPRMLETESCVLVSVPTTLKRLAHHTRTRMLRARCQAIFSSGGPLGSETAFEIAAQMGNPPIEVLGSTETGGIAWRQQRPEERVSLWTPFPSVRVTRDEQTGLLRVNSPFVSVNNECEGGFATGDRISLKNDGRFVLEGRLDQIVKVGEKRLDLAQMASELRGHECVEDAALLTIEREGELRVAAVVVPSIRGSELIEREGRGSLSRGLRASLAMTFDPVLHPRYWRIVHELPTDSRGKLPLNTLRALFGASQSDEVMADRPDVLSELSGSDSVERACRVPLDLVCFSGHFPREPVVPGVLQLDWAMEMVAQHLGHIPRATEIESLKLTSPLRPGQRFRIRIRITSDAIVEFKVWSKEATYSTGRVRLEMS